MHIRLAADRDLASIVKLAEQINLQHFQGAPNVFSDPETAAVGAKGFWQGKLNESESRFYVAEIDEQVAGFIVGKVTRNIEVNFICKNSVARVNTVVVAEKYQGRGVGKKLMQAFQEWAEDKKAVEVRLEVMEFNQSAQSFYAELGYGTQSRIMSKPLHH